MTEFFDKFEAFLQKIFKVITDIFKLFIKENPDDVTQAQ